jgi:hypothetical protein
MKGTGSWNVDSPLGMDYSVLWRIQAMNSLSNLQKVSPFRLPINMTGWPEEACIASTNFCMTLIIR